MSASTNLQPILDFLPCVTPSGWVDAAVKPENLSILLSDHANCERKAAESALSTIKRYGTGLPGDGNPASAEHYRLMQKLSRLAREEMHHFEQVIALLKRRNIPYRHTSAARYAAGLRSHVRSSEPARLVDTLLIGGIIEARSCERFAALAPRLDPELGRFYSSLLQSESRHFQDYLKLARSLSSDQEVSARLALLLPAEAQLIESGDSEFRFHSGDPQT